VTHDVVLTPVAVRQLAGTEPPVRWCVAGALDLLAEDPFPPVARRVEGGRGERSVRVAGARVLYEVTSATVTVLAVRREAG
jgi:mRNA interferase RelE/StbE